VRCPCTMPEMPRKGSRTVAVHASYRCRRAATSREAERGPRTRRTAIYLLQRCTRVLARGRRNRCAPARRCAEPECRRRARHAHRYPGDVFTRFTRQAQCRKRFAASEHARSGTRLSAGESSTRMRERSSQPRQVIRCRVRAQFDAEREKRATPDQNATAAHDAREEKSWV